MDSGFIVIVEEIYEVEVIVRWWWDGDIESMDKWVYSIIWGEYMWGISGVEYTRYSGFIWVYVVVSIYI